MASVVDWLYVHDIAIACPLDPEDDLVLWKDVKFVARALIGDQLLNETGEHLPVIHECAKTVARWELSGLQVPTECLSFTLAITTTGHYQIFCFEFQRHPDGDWSLEEDRSQGPGVHLNFRAQATLRHSPSRFHKRYFATSDFVQISDIPHAEPWDEQTPCPQMESVPAQQLLHIGRDHYTRFQGGEKAQLKPALTTFERALDDPDIDPALSQVLETIIPFLYCLEQGSSSCPEVAFEVLQTFPGLPNTQIDAQLLLQIVVQDFADSFEWLDYIPLAIKSITGPLDVFLRSASLDLHPLHPLRLWVKAVVRLAPDAEEVLPLMNLAANLFPGVYRTPDGSESFAILRANVYFEQAARPGGPSLDATLRVAEFAMHSLSDLDDSLGPLSGLLKVQDFTRLSSHWLITCHNRGGFDALEPYKDRLLCLVAWQLSNLSFLPVVQHKLILLQSLLTNKELFFWEFMNKSIPGSATLDDNDNQFIKGCYMDLGDDVISGKDIPVASSVEYPQGAAKMVRIFLAEVANSIPDPRVYAMIAAIARALLLPEALKVYELFMGLLESLTHSARFLCSDQLKGAGRSSSVIRDAISYASYVGNHALALQWSDQGRSKIWDWFFHSRSSIGRGHALEPIVASKLRTRPTWIDSWTSTQKDDPTPTNNDNAEFNWMVEGFNLMPGLDRFLRPKTPVEIMSIAKALGGPIVYLSPNRYSSHALAVLPGLDHIVHIPLPNLNYRELRNLSVEFMKSPKSFLVREDDSSAERKGHAVKPNLGHSAKRRFAAMLLLEQLWSTVVKPVLDGLGIKQAQTRTVDKPRIWWSPSGPLSSFPIHAAGIYTDDGHARGPVLSDYVVSSYFSSASALAFATRPENPSQKFSLLTIANPTGAGLPGTESELEKIKKHTKTRELTCGGATVEAVKNEMEHASWVHFACHGIAKPDEPMESALILANHAHLTLREISDMSLPQAEFAFLSACYTARGVAEAPDQAAHLSTGMLVCGYRSVIGTMWQISDGYAPFVADHVYAKMLEGGQSDYRRAACALHDAVQALRKEHKVGFETWLPFIHVGV